MNKFTCQCKDCKAKYEVVIAHQEDIVCPGCDGKHTKVLKQEEIETPGCSGCSRCSVCH